jgi:hypothetical protein
MEIDMHIFTWRTKCLTGFLVTAVLLAAKQVIAGECVLAIVPATNPPSTFTRLMIFSAEGSKEIAQLKGPVWLGSDADSVALLQMADKNSVQFVGNRPG